MANNFGQLIRTSQTIVQDPSGWKVLSELKSPRSQSEEFDPERIKKPQVIIASIVLDTSQSMEDYTDHEGHKQNGQAAVISCFARMLKELKSGESPRHAVVLGTWGFNGMIHPYQLPQDVVPLNQQTYTPGGGTPLFDTIDECFAYSDSRALMLRERHMNCKRAFMIVSDGSENESRRITTVEQMRERIEEVLGARENFIFGVGMGRAGCDQLQEIGIPAEMIRDVSRGVGLASIFREFTTMTTQGGGGLSPVRRDMRRHQ